MIKELRSYFKQKESKNNLTQLIEEIVSSKWEDIDDKAYKHVFNRQELLTLEAEAWLTAVCSWDNKSTEMFWGFGLQADRISSLDNFFGRNNREQIPVLLKPRLDSMTPCLRKLLLTRIYSLLSSS